MTFREMPYSRPDVEAVKNEYAALTGRLRAATSYAQARDVFLERDALERRVQTLATLCSIRHSIDTRDEFYDAEERFWNDAGPELEEYGQQWTAAMLESPFRAAFSAEYGDLLFRNAEIARRAFDPALIPQLQKENELVQAYQKLLASAQVAFEGGTYTLSQLAPFKTDPDDSRRLAAWKAEGAWYKANQAELDRIYDELVRLRDAMGRALGHKNYIPLGYDRMTRNCYGQAEVERFRAAVREYVVPLAETIYRRQAARLGVAYPMSFADAALEFRSGNPRPAGTPQEILETGRRFYEALSPETGAFFNKMLDMELLDVLSTEGKAAGGYCTSLPDYGMPFIFANFNGTQHDVEVVTHEAGHAFANYVNRDRVPLEYQWPGMEACEVHSMSMECFAEPWAEDFFGPDARKFRFSHLAGMLCFLPYGTMVDHFQHIVYERPELTPAERHGEWKKLLGVYMPWLRLDGDIPFYADGEAWQRQQHIYGMPFYYIDYCLAQTVALQFWARIGEDKAAAWEKYMAYTRLGGSRDFVTLLREAGLDSPFEGGCLRAVCEAAGSWLERCDLTGIV